MDKLKPCPFCGGKAITECWASGGIMYMVKCGNPDCTVVFDDGTVLVEQAHTTDGIWRTDKKVLGGTVVAWMDYPKPYKEDRS